MASLNNPNVFIQVRIDRETNIGRFQDAMYFTAAEYQALTNQQVIDLAIARAQAWRDAVLAARSDPPRTPTREERLARKAELEAELAAINEALEE